MCYYTIGIHHIGGQLGVGIAPCLVVMWRLAPHANVEVVVTLAGEACPPCDVRLANNLAYGDVRLANYSLW